MIVPCFFLKKHNKSTIFAPPCDVAVAAGTARGRWARRTMRACPRHPQHFHSCSAPAPIPCSSGPCPCWPHALHAAIPPAIGPTAACATIRRHSRKRRPASDQVGTGWWSWWWRRGTPGAGRWSGSGAVCPPISADYCKQGLEQKMKRKNF